MSSGEFEALFVNDPDNDYALTMEITHADEIVAIVRQHSGALVLDIYPLSKPVTIPLDWVIDRLEAAKTDLSKEGTQS